MRLSPAFHALPLAGLLTLGASIGAAQSVLDRVQGFYFPEGFGTWDCRSLGSDGGAVGVQGDILHGVESQCQLTNAKPVPGMDAMVFGTSCRGEGMEWDGGNVLLMPAEGGALTILRDGGFATTWQRCP